jgi:hypothetical protein
MSMTAYGATQAREHARIPLIEALQTSYVRREFFSPCRVDPGNFTPSLSQIPDVNLSIHPARATA